MIEEYITDICYLLNIKEPYVSYDVTGFATDTTMAQCDVVNNIIYLNKLDKPNPDYLFCIAHELRHIWQYQTDKKFYLSDYKSSDKCLSIEEYNLQIAELDANAFAAIVMIDFFSIKPQWNGLSGKVLMQLINKLTY